MNKQVILSIESKDSVFKEYRWFWVRSVYDFVPKDNAKACTDYLKGERIFTAANYKEGIPTHQSIPFEIDTSYSKAKMLFGESKEKEQNHPLEIAHYLCLDFTKNSMTMKGKTIST